MIIFVSSINAEQYMKHLQYLVLLIFLSSAYSISISAQESVKLLPQFTAGSILMRNKAVIKASVNYDTTNDKLLYKDGDKIMELTNMMDIDTIYVAHHKLIVMGLGYYEVKPLSTGTLYIKWHLRQLKVGKKGAYGQTTQNYVQDINTATFNNKGVINYESSDVFNTINNNQYSIINGKKTLRFNNKKSFIKLFSNKKDEIENYISTNQIDFQKIDDIVKLCNYCLQQ
jgi:hypothetical protein